MAWGVVTTNLRVLFEPILVRLGLARFPIFGRFMGALEAFNISPIMLQLKNVFDAIQKAMLSNPITAAFWAQFMVWIIAKQDAIFESVKNNASDIWDKHGGDLSDYMVELAGTFLTEYIAEATEAKTGHALRLHLALPMNAAQVEIIGGDVGTWLADIANAKVGTNFTSLYPPENLKTELRNQVMAEITSGTRNILSEADVQAFIVQIRQISDNDLVQQFGVTQAIATGLGLPIPPANLEPQTKAARRRAQNREAQRKWRQTHGRDSTWYPAGSISSPHPVT